MHLLLGILQLMFLATAVLHIRPVQYMSDGTSSPEMLYYCLAVWLNMAYVMFLYLEIRFFGVDGQECAKYAAMTSVLVEMPSFILVSAATIYAATKLYGSEHASDHSSEDDDHHRILAEEGKDETFRHIPIILMLCSWFTRQALFYPIRYLRGKGEDIRKFTVPMNVHFIIDRHGEWTMLMLGT